MASPTRPRVTMEEKIASICSHIKSFNLTPKSFLTAFLSHSVMNAAFRRRFWGTVGWPGTERLLHSVKNLVCAHLEGQGHWEDFILDQAIAIARSERPRSGRYPEGAYVNSASLSVDFFTERERLARNRALTNQMPFMYKLMFAKLQAGDDLGDEEEEEGFDLADDEELEGSTQGNVFGPEGTNVGSTQLATDGVPTELLNRDENNPLGPLDSDGATPPPKDDFNLTEDDINEFEGGFLCRSPDRQVRRRVRVETMARTICAMLAFGTNRRHNGFQLSNSLIFMASGVTERVNSYLNYIGLCSSRKTAHVALKSLGQEAEKNLIVRFSLEKAPLVPPIICYDNLDFQQKVHMKSVGHSSVMFHGTWGYIHSIPPSVRKSLDPTQLTTEALKQALHNASKLKIQPRMFAPSLQSTNHFEATLKSQITQVILRYIATPFDREVELAKDPPAVQPLAPELPNISMLKLMIASDNSATGVGEVFTGVIQQSGLTPEEFHSRLQLVEGDLGSCNIFDSLRAQRTPVRRHASALDNILPIPGAAHTLWNLAQSIFLAHWGDETHSRDTGAWRTLHALGIPADKPVTKKDFNLMLSHIQKIHEVTLIYCVL
ncbi:hypothetical protein PGT21_034695 [Puccinia graminis f. sp. tritici]|uniref:DUF6589 domain-containing protein n=1 Tax=Puccinia graminis f. sp. tritici TaxID=56615 RepID=A0A5B0R3H4_PUCGR|nr:hypothetical protein PGT21_034695 [Puccinia graminis f. sp. tritici]